MSGEPELLAPATQDTAPVADAAPPVAPPEAEEPDVIEIPTGEKLVPLSALTGARETLKSTKAELAALKEQAGQTAEKDARIAALEARINELSPRAQAYDAALQAQQHQQAAPKGPTAEEQSELEEIAKDLDFYRTDGSLDLDRAQRFQQREQRRAEKIAQQHVEPFAAQTVADRSHHMLQRAMATKAPDGAQPDPEVLREVWGRLDKRLTATPEGAAQAFSVALGHSALLGKLKGKPAAQAEVIPPPLETERAGGKEGADGPSLRDSDRRAARDMGLTDKEYAAVLKDMPAGWGKGS